jgi:hypothetical protein
LEYVNVSIEGFGTGAFSSIDGNFSISYGSTAQTVPFFAWTSPPAGLNKAVFSQPVGPMSGLLFTTHQSVGNSTISSPLPLSTGSGTVPKLIEGVYVLTNAPVNLSAYSYNPNLPATPVAVVAESVTPASFPYVVITIASR